VGGDALSTLLYTPFINFSLELIYESIEIKYDSERPKNIGECCEFILAS
jgi:hypothetical protein